MPNMPINFVGEAYNMPATQLDAQTCINWYIVKDATGKSSQALFPDPALKLFSARSGDGTIRGLFELNNVLYGVHGNKFLIYDAHGNSHEKGTLNTSSGNVRMIANYSQIFISDGQFGYVYQLIKSDTREVGAFFIIAEATSFIGTPKFTGAGLDDMSIDGVYIGNSSKKYKIEIDSVGTAPTADTFRWSDSDGTTWNAEKIPITEADQQLNDGVTVRFIHKDGHTIKDYWEFDVSVDSAFYVPIIPAYQDTYGIYIKQSSNIFYISSSNDFSVVNALDFARNISLPDNLVAAISIREEVWFLSRDITTVWYDTGAEVFPFEPRTNLVLTYGCAAPYSLALGHNNILFWLARNKDGARVVVMASGYDITVISSEPINTQLKRYSEVEDAIGFVYQWNGHVFYALILPTADKTFIYDLTTSSWHERQCRIPNALPSAKEYRLGRWRANNFVYFAGKYLVGDFENGNIYELTDTEYLDNGELIPCERTTQVLQNNLNRICINSLQIDFEAGEGLTSGQGENPQAMLQISHDGGVTWSSELWRDMGRIGRYKARAKWNRLGTSRAPIFRLRITDPVYRVVLGAVADIEDMG